MDRLGHCIVIALFLSMSTAAIAKNRAVEIDIGGIGPGVDDAAYQTVRQVIGYSVANGTIDKFIVSSYGIEGGFSACAEAAPSVKANILKAFVRQLRTIHPDPGTTAYSVKLTSSCVKDEHVVCTQEAKQCPDGSFVGRAPPSCQFALCPGE